MARWLSHLEMSHGLNENANVYYTPGRWQQTHPHNLEFPKNTGQHQKHDPKDEEKKPIKFYRL